MKKILEGSEKSSFILKVNFSIMVLIDRVSSIWGKKTREKKLKFSLGKLFFTP